jgi:hypothetical protein
MMLELNERERDLLVRLLQADRDETGTEIHHAMDYKTRDSLREERQMLDRLLQRLGVPLPTTR